MPSLSGVRRGRTKARLRPAFCALAAGGALAFAALSFVATAPAAAAAPAAPVRHAAPASTAPALHAAAAPRPGPTAPPAPTHPAHAARPGHRSAHATPALRNGAAAPAPKPAAAPRPATAHAAKSNGHAEPGARPAPHPAAKPAKGHRVPGPNGKQGKKALRAPGPSSQSSPLRPPQTPNPHRAPPGGLVVRLLSPLIPFSPGVPIGPSPKGGLPLGLLNGPGFPLPGRDLFHFPFSILNQGWAGQSLQAASKLKVPISLLAAAAVFLLIQALVDRRDPKVVRAPEHPGEDTVSFR